MSYLNITQKDCKRFLRTIQDLHDDLNQLWDFPMCLSSEEQKIEEEKMEAEDGYEEAVKLWGLFNEIKDAINFLMEARK